MSARIESRAERVLQEAGITEPPVDVEEIARRLGGEVVIAEMAADISGMLIRDETQTIIGVNEAHASVRQRFSIAHEIGHLLFHRGELVHVDRPLRVDKRDGRSSLAVHRDEIQANAFAASLLMPRWMIENALGGLPHDMDPDEIVRELSGRFEVSRAAISYRLINLGLLEPDGD